MKKDLGGGVGWGVVLQFIAASLLLKGCKQTETHCKFIYVPVNIHFPPNHCNAGDK